MGVVVICVIFSSRDDRHLGDAHHDGFHPGGPGHVSNPCVHRIRGHSVYTHVSLSDSDNRCRSSSLHGSRLKRRLQALQPGLRGLPGLLF